MEMSEHAIENFYWKVQEPEQFSKLEKLRE